MRTFRILLQKELLEHVRTMRLVSVAAVFLFIGLGSPVFAKFAPDIISAAGGPAMARLIPTPTMVDAVIQFDKNLGQFGAVLAILVAMGSVVVEKERGTAGFVLTRPVGRGQFLLAKFTALAALLTGGMILAGAAAYLYTAILFKPLDAVAFAALCAILLLAILVYLAITFVLSTALESQIAAGGLSFLTILTGGAISVVPRIGAYTPAGLMGQGQALALGQRTEPLLGPIILNVALITACWIAATLAFRRQELR